MKALSTLRNRICQNWPATQVDMATSIMTGVRSLIDRRKAPSNPDGGLGRGGGRGRGGRGRGGRGHGQITTTPSQLSAVATAPEIPPHEVSQ